MLLRQNTTNVSRNFVGNVVCRYKHGNVAKLMVTTGKFNTSECVVVELPQINAAIKRKALPVQT